MLYEVVEDRIISNDRAVSARIRLNALIRYEDVDLDIDSGAESALLWSSNFLSSSHREDMHWIWDTFRRSYRAVRSEVSDVHANVEDEDEATETLRKANLYSSFPWILSTSFFALSTIVLGMQLKRTMSRYSYETGFRTDLGKSTQCFPHNALVH